MCAGENVFSVVGSMRVCARKDVHCFCLGFDPTWI